MLPIQNPANPVSTKFSCTFSIKENTSKLKASMALAQFLSVDVRAAQYLMKRTHRLSYLNSESFNLMYLTSNECDVVKVALGGYFDLTFWPCEAPTVVFGNYPPWVHTATLVE